MTYPVWIDESWVDVPVPEMAGEPLVVPNIAAVVLDEQKTAMLLQRRDKAGEPVRGKLELPGGRWGAGERPEVAATREVLEETGVSVLATQSKTGSVRISANRACAFVRPIGVVNGIEGAYPSLHVIVEMIGEGTPVGSPGETADPRWWPIKEVRRHLDRAPEDFVDQTRAMLTLYFDQISS